MHPSCQRFGVEVFISEEGDYQTPWCPHGPMLMFERYFESKPPRRFFACSACRDRKECSFFQWADESPSKVSIEAHQKIIEASQPLMNAKQFGKRLKIVKSLNDYERTYCHTCDLLLLPKELKKHAKHEILCNVTNEMITNASRFLKPKENKKSHAQYLFNNDAIEFFLNTFQTLGYQKIICVGTPRIHEAIQTRKTGVIDSILLDIDHRHAQFLEDDHFIHYNMFNHHFFEKDHAMVCFKKFLYNSLPSSLMVILDPPFGGLVQVLSVSLKKLWKLVLNYVKEGDDYHLSCLSTFWIFPYFMESHITKELPFFKMCDFKVDYDNHPLYKKHFKTKKLSPVRVFTNVLLKTIILPPNDYRFCDKCQRYVSKENLHCDLCNDCPSKHNIVWQHCLICGKCVKKGYVHCDICKSCKPPGHDCER
ncbi:rRNA N6-adenosine-methyltransferase ZCCHC4-like isoform X2 [Xenia sp. Carnegie-2017]|uniref:rRNA N6-adenosine-methyltransferase ZCCHC4-like isoform X2 n=1 Tax=Xenia sp. Carnegie-2017 TaxID=2897299 RepID=UPI001F03545C|nr:rRNA N6-adenosine-methyltransferase ZCCHC4-like isoform X2 [Xenia sp. Carnegie-2017]